jgi:glycosyltransferase involved in cell wall biosynthesis
MAATPRTILYLITKAERGGAQSHVLELLKATRGRGARPVLACGDEGFLTGAARGLGIDVHRIANLVHPVRPAKDLAAVAEVTRLLRRLQPDLIHCHSSKAGLVGRLAAWRAGVPAVFTAHGWEFAPGLSPLRRAMVWPAEWVAARCSARIITVSERDRRLAVAARVARPDRLATVHNGIPDVPRQAAPGSPGTVEFVTVARLASPKDPYTLLRALRAVRGDWRLTFAGGGPDLPRVRALAQELAIDARVRFLGETDDVAGLLARSGVFVLTSHKEGFPITVLEAMRAGLPVVASDVGGVAEQVVDGETGFLVPGNDPAPLTRRLQHLLDDPARRDAMGGLGRKRYLERFTLEKMAGSTWAVYEGVFSEVGAKQPAFPCVPDVREPICPTPGPRYN